LPLWLARFWLDKSQRLLLHPVIWPVLGFLGYAAWRAAHVDVAYPARMELFQLGVAALVFVLALQNLHRQELIRWAVNCFAALGCVLAAYAVVQLLSQSDHVLWLRQPPGYLKRAGGTFINPNHLAAFLVAIFPLSVAQVFIGRDKPLAKILHGYAALMMLAGIAVTMSRGGWAAAVLALLLLLGWMLWRRRELRIPLLVFLALLLAAGAFFLRNVEKAQARLENVSATDNIDAGSSRLWIWRPAWRMWLDQPWLGVGPAQFDPRFPAYRPPQVQTNPGWVHNEYLNLLVDYGLAGALLAAAVAGIYLWGLVKTSKYVERGSDLGWKASNRTAFFTGGTIGLAALACHCFVDFNLHIPAIALVAGLLAGLLASNIRFATERFWLGGRWWNRSLVTGAGLAVLFWLVPTTARAAREAIHLQRAANAAAITPQLLADLGRAAEAAPDNARTAFEIGENMRRLSFDGGSGWREQGEAALPWLERSTRLNPHDARARLALARTRYWIGDTNRAAADFEAALKLGPNDVNLANYVAWNLLTRGRTNEASALIDQSLTWDPWGNWMAKHYRAQLDEALKPKK
jgi:O-antigen ligase